MHPQIPLFIFLIAAYVIDLLYFICPLVLGLVVFSHWILDVIDWDNVPIFFDKAQRIGLGLYDKIGFSLTGMKLNSGTVLATSIELSMLIAGIVIYVLFRRKTRT